MRLFDLTLVVRLGSDGSPDVKVDLDLEDGVPTEYLAVAPGILRSVANQMEQQLKDGTANVVER